MLIPVDCHCERFLDPIVAIILDSAVECLLVCWRSDFIEQLTVLSFTHWVSPTALHGLAKNLNPAVIVIALGKG